METCLLTKILENETKLKDPIATWVKKLSDNPDDDRYYYECSNCGQRKLHTNLHFTFDGKYCPTCGKRIFSYYNVLNNEVDNVEPGIYRHFKGRYYQVLCVAEHSETSEKLVVYQELHNGQKIYCRPISMFIDFVDNEKYDYRGPRFCRVEFE